MYITNKDIENDLVKETVYMSVWNTLLTQVYIMCLYVYIYTCVYVQLDIEYSNSAGGLGVPPPSISTLPDDSLLS